MHKQHVSESVVRLPLAEESCDCIHSPSYSVLNWISFSLFRLLRVFDLPLPPPRPLHSLHPSVDKRSAGGGEDEETSSGQRFVSPGPSLGCSTSVGLVHEQQIADSPARSSRKSDDMFEHRTQ